MTYELLKRLKDSGFPLRHVVVEAGREITLERPAVVFSLSAAAAEVGIYYFPSVSDLVEACGNHLRNMFRVDSGWVCNQQERRFGDEPSAETRGATLDEALAELWLIHAGSAA
jgi:hypothetical protein